MCSVCVTRGQTRQAERESAAQTAKGSGCLIAMFPLVTAIAGLVMNIPRRKRVDCQ